ncbi:DUF3291 domain-containing protein [Sedimentitalea sp. XS_ASV28]|uniref:DUF3291 domain-containing protein n=1 Tax=Sedimentitalea sp. XS_ASV28 TaxID=3241296 RepID=UPI003516BE5D
MAIAQMNWGRMLHPLDDPRMREFADRLDAVYRLAEAASGFIWRIDEAQLTADLSKLGYDPLTSATVSTWRTMEDLKRYTYETEHGEFLKRTGEWFEAVEGPQLVIWPVEPSEQPGFMEAQLRLDYLKRHGPSDYAHGWC